MQDMPDITLMRSLRTHPADGLPDGSPSITDRGVPVQTLLLQFPQQQGPTLPIHGHRASAGPDRSTAHIDYTEVGLAMLIAIHLVQGQSSRCSRPMAAHPLHRSRTGLLYHRGNPAHAHMLSQQLTQTALDTAITSVTFYQQRYDRALQLNLIASHPILGRSQCCV